MELLINLSESYHTLIGIFAQRNPLKNWPMSFFYSMAVILISYSFSIFGFPTYVSQLVIFVVLLTGALIEPSDDKTNAMVKATIFATLPYINLKLDGFIQDFFLSNIQIESIETELIVSHIISLILSCWLALKCPFISIVRTSSIGSVSGLSRFSFLFTSSLFIAIWL